MSRVRIGFEAEDMSFGTGMVRLTGRENLPHPLPFQLGGLAGTAHLVSAPTIRTSETGNDVAFDIEIIFPRGSEPTLVDIYKLLGAEVTE